MFSVGKKVVLFGSPKSRSRRTRGLTDQQIKLIFLLPTFALLVFLIIYPLLWSAILSFSNYNTLQGQATLFQRPSSKNKNGIRMVRPHGIGLKNYREILRDKYVWKHFQTTGKFVVISVVAQTLIGLGLALLFNRPFPGKGPITTLILVPMMLSPVVVGLFWKYMLSPQWGVVDYFLSAVFRIPPVTWLANSNSALYGVVIADTWMWSPFMFLFAYSGISAIPKYLYEAADVNKATAWFKFTRITLPLMSPLMLIAVIFRTMDAFKLFDIGWGMTQGGPGSSTETVTMLIYRSAFVEGNTGYACALAYILLILIIGLSNIYIKYLNQLRRR